MRCTLISMVITNSPVDSSASVPWLSWSSCGDSEAFVSKRHSHSLERAIALAAKIQDLNCERLDLLALIESMEVALVGGEVDEMLVESMMGEAVAICELIGHRKGVRHEHLAIIDRELEKRGLRVAPARVCDDGPWGWIGFDISMGIRSNDYRKSGSDKEDYSTLKGILNMFL